MQLPEGLPSGEVSVTIELPNDPENAPITPEELDELLTIEPLTGAEIVKAGLLGGWEHKGITDSAAWVESQRKKRRDQTGW